MPSQDISEQEMEASIERDVAEELRRVLAQGDPDALALCVDSLAPGEITRVMAQLSEDEQSQILSVLHPRDAADLLDDLPDEHAADILEYISAEDAAAIVEELDSDDRADVLGEMEEDDAEAILDALPLDDAIETRQLLSYPSDTAGGVMATEFVAYPTGTTVQEVLDDLRQNRKAYRYYNVQYFYVTDENGVLKGVLRLRDLVLSRADRPIDQVMITDPDVVQAKADLDTLQAMLETHSYSALPVVDRAGRILGAAVEKDVAEAARKKANETLLKVTGIFRGEELRSMPTSSRVGQRLPWLFVIMLLNLAAASVIAVYTSTLEKMIWLAVFLPVVAGMSGSSGNQAVGVTLRELALGVAKPWDILYVLFKEMKVGIINGLALGVLLGLIVIFTGRAWQWPNITQLGFVVGTALALNTILAVCIGGTLPLFLKRMKVDPAMASGPVCTMVADAAGFFLVLSLWALLMH